MVSNWSRQAWEPATTECPQVNLTQQLNSLPYAPSQMLLLPLLKTLVSSSGVLSASSFTLWSAQAKDLFLLNATDHLSGSVQQEARLMRSHYAPQAWSPLPFVHKHSHWTGLLPSPYETLSDLTWISPPVSLLSLLCNLAFNLLPSSSSFPHSITLSDLTLLLSSSEHRLSPELVDSPTTIEPVTCGVSVSGQGAELLHGDKRSVTEWWRAQTRKKHLDSKWQESPSKQKTPNPVCAIWVSNHPLDVNCFVGAGTATVFLYLPY